MDALKLLDELMDLRELGRLFQSAGALYLKARRPASFLILLGIVK